MTKGGFFDFYEQVRGKRSTNAPTDPATAPATNPSGTASVVAPQGHEPLTVSQLTARIDRAVKQGLPDTLHVRGEISNFRPNQGSGHLYFTLKDAANCIDCVMWKSDAARLKFTPADGIELLAGGRVGIYGQRGKYQLYVTSLRPLGKGALELAFQQLKAKLEAEGLFEADRKKPLPRYPMTAALVTGANTAALADMLKVLRRFRSLRILLYPVPVQGEGASARIAEALSTISRGGEDLGIDVILLARGGGSLEDLWAFNEEVVARAIAASRLPVVTGIGHEVDTSIADLVADYHAHTPTEAAQVVSGLWRGAGEAIDVSALRLRRILAARLQDARQRLRTIERHEAFRRPLDRINSHRQLLDDRQRAMTTAMTHRLHQSQWRLQDLQSHLNRHMPAALVAMRERLNTLRQNLSIAVATRLRRSNDTISSLATRLAEFHPKYRLRLHQQRLTALSDRLARSSKADLVLRRQQLDAMERQLHAIGPENVLRRGYTMTFRKKSGVLIRATAEIKPGDHLLTRFADGTVESVAEDPDQPTLWGGTEQSG